METQIDITMPSLGADMQQGMLVEWLVNVGDKVKSGDTIAVLETQKGAIDMEVYHDGVISEILIQPVATLAVGTLMAKIAIDEELMVNLAARNEPLLAEQVIEKATIAQTTLDKTPTDHVSTHQTPIDQIPIDLMTRKTQKEKIIKPVLSTATIATPATTRIASPVVRKLAQQQHLDLVNIKGSGPNGAIVLKDIEGMLIDGRENPPLAISKSSIVNIRSAIAAAMTKSKKEIPHFYLSLMIDISDAQQWLQKLNKEKSPQAHILLLALLIKAVAQALVKYPSLNGFYLNGQFEQADDINIGNVISLRKGGVVVPALHHVDQRSVISIMQDLRDVTARSRADGRLGRLRSSELTDATFTITSMGERGADSVFGIIYPPQVAIVGFGKPQKRPQIHQGKMLDTDVINVSLSADHRVIDGMLAAKFLNTIAKKLQKPELL